MKHKKLIIALLLLAPAHLIFSSFREESKAKTYDRIKNSLLSKDINEISCGLLLIEIELYNPENTEADLKELYKLPKTPLFLQRSGRGFGGRGTWSYYSIDEDSSLSEDRHCFICGASPLARSMHSEANVTWKTFIQLLEEQNKAKESGDTDRVEQLKNLWSPSNEEEEKQLKEKLEELKASSQ